jgi:hypothetical protein
MTVREQRKSRTDKSPDLDRPVIIFDEPADGSSRPAWRLTLAVLVLVVAAAGAVSWWATRGGDQVLVRPAVQAPAQAPAPVQAPARLAVTVAAPGVVVAGQAARFVVSYTDGSGIFGGSVEDWGEVGVGSMKQRACSASTPVAAPVQGSYVAVHKWRAAGSYPVSFAVTTYTCSNGQATEETHKAQLTVIVAGR